MTPRLLLLCCLLPAVTGRAVDRPNILWLIVEDFGQHLGCYGAKEVWSPNLDKLAMDGPAPVMPGADGKYPIPEPGIKKTREY